MSEKFGRVNFVVNFDGKFMGESDAKIYVGGKVEQIHDIDVDLVSYFEIVGLFEDNHINYCKEDDVLYLKPGQRQLIWDALIKIKGDTEVQQMIEDYEGTNRDFVLYIMHKTSVLEDHENVDCVRDDHGDDVNGGVSETEVGDVNGKWDFIDYTHLRDKDDDNASDVASEELTEEDRVSFPLFDEEIHPDLFAPNRTNEVGDGHEKQKRKKPRSKGERTDKSILKYGLCEPDLLDKTELNVPSDGDNDEGRVRPPRYQHDMDIENIQLKPYQNFGSASVFREVVRDIAIRDGRSVVFVKNEPKRVTVECTSEHCQYRLHGSLVPDTGDFLLKSWHFEHTCVSYYTLVPVSSRWVLNKFMDRIRSNPRYPVSSLIEDVAKEYNVDISVNQAYKVKKDAMVKLYGDYKKQYGQMWDYCNALLKSNNGRDCVKLKFEIQREGGEDTYLFQRVFISFEATKNTFFNGCRPVIGLDGTFLKGGYGGILLTATCNDGNNNCLLIAYAVVENECYATWRWFMDHLTDYIGDTWCFISDRQKGLQKIFEKDMESSEWRICCRHLYANFRDQGFGGSQLKELLWNAARSYCKADFDAYMAEISKVNEDACKYLNAIDPRQWSRHAFKVWTRSDELTNNSSESFNKDILELRDKPIITMLEGIRTMTMLKFQHKREGAASHQLAYTPLALGRLGETIHGSRYCKPLYSGNGIYQVEDRDRRWVVDVKKGECGCGFWELTGIPCKHAVCALQKSGEQPESHISRFYSLEVYKKCYEQLILPLPSADQWEKTGLTPLAPPIMKPKTGRPAHKRRKSKHEDEYKPRTRMKSQRCSNCKEIGHKYIHCPQPLKEGLKIRKRPCQANTTCNEQREGTTEDGGLNEQREMTTDFNLSHGRKHKTIKRAKLTPYRSKRRKVISQEGGPSNATTQTLVPRYVETDSGMGIVYGKQVRSRGTKTGRGRGRPPKNKHNEGIEPPAATSNNNLLKIHVSEMEKEAVQTTRGRGSLIGRGLLSRGKGWRPSRRPQEDLSPGPSRFSLSQPTTATERQLDQQPRVNLSQPTSSTSDRTFEGLTNWSTGDASNEVQKRVLKNWVNSLVGLRK